MPTWKRILPLLLAVFLVAPLACQQGKPPADSPPTSTEGGEPGPQVKEESDPNIRFGMPAAAGKEREAYLISRPQYTLSYNGKTRDPNWVCWRLRNEDIGHAKRGAFNPDPLLPQNISHVSSHVYDNSGFDRGHMCAAKDRSATQADMDATFFTSNIVPQAPLCNQRGWERLEAYCRELTKDSHVLWIACGPHGQGGEGKDGKKDVIGPARTEVVVPNKVWKVILVLPREDAAPTRASRTIATIFPNDQTVDYAWSKYRCSVAEVEKLTGLKFWPSLPADLARDLKTKVDDVQIREPKQKKDSE